MKEKLKLLVCVLGTALLFCGCKKELPELAVPQMTNISELGTVEYLVTKSIEADENSSWYKIGDRKIIFSCDASIVAGVDMSNFDANSIKVDQKGRSVSLELPEPEILSLDITREHKEWEKVGKLRWKFTPQEKLALKKQAELEIRESLNDMNILNDAKDNARMFITNLMKSAGFEKVDVHFVKTERSDGENQQEQEN